MNYITAFSPILQIPSIASIINMENTVSIEYATPDVLDQILEIEENCFAADSFSKKQFVYLMTKAKGVFYVAKIKERVVAYISVVTNKYINYARIYSIAVHPDFRRYKLGQLLIEKTISYTRQNKFKFLLLEVKTTNIAAISLYEKNGFVKTHIKQYYYADGSDAYSMRLNLTY